MRKTKIVCTLGPAAEEEEVIRKMMISGMDVARFNFSHGTQEIQKRRFAIIKKLRKELNKHTATLLDTRGPEIRIGSLKKGRAELATGQLFTLTTEEIEGTEERVSVTYPNLVNDVKTGDRILIDDGLIAMEVEKVFNKEIICRVKNGGVISNHKGMNIPEVKLHMPFISQKDYEDILFGIELGFDFIAASFTRCAEDIRQIRRILKEKNCSSVHIIAKIENVQGVENIDEIIEAADGIMIARGDMGVELPLEEVPVIQKMIINKVYHAGKQVITATQMLESMMKNPRPTRAEVTDVANAIYQRTSAVMLSGETAAGMYPVEAVKTMVRIAERTEQDIDYQQDFCSGIQQSGPDITNAISHATCTTAADLNAAAIVTVTMSGRTARMISKYRPACPIIGCSMDAFVCRHLSLSWGVIPLQIDREEDTDALFCHAVDCAQKNGLLKKGDTAVLTAGVPLGISGTTNLIKAVIAE